MSRNEFKFLHDGGAPSETLTNKIYTLTCSCGRIIRVFVEICYVSTYRASTERLMFWY